MALDPNIPLQSRAPDPIDPMAKMGEAMQLRQMGQQGEIQSLDLQQRQQAVDKQQKLMALFQNPPASPDDLIRQVGQIDPNYAASLQESMAKAKAAKIKEYTDQVGLVTDVAKRALKIAPDGTQTVDDDAYHAGIGDLMARGVLDGKEGLRLISIPPGPDRVTAVNGYLQQAMSAQQVLDQQATAQRKALEMRKLQADTDKSVVEADRLKNTPPSEPVEAVVGPDGPPGYVKRSEAVGKTPYQKPPTVNLSGMNALYADIDPKAIAQGIISGEQPPDISSLGRPAGAAVASELARAKYPLADAVREYKAQIKLGATMNGAQQVRLDESIRSGLAMYDKVDELAGAWNGKGWGPLSRANLVAATNGAMGPEAAKTAIALSGAIGQLTSDVATIEQGGLTPTSEARAVAERSLRDWWGTGTIQNMTQQGRWMMQARHLARQTQETMTPGNNPSMAPAQPATPGGPQAPAFKVGDIKTFPNGNKARWDGTGWELIK